MLVLRINFQKSEIFLQILPLLAPKRKIKEKFSIKKKKLKNIRYIVYNKSS